MVDTVFLLFLMIILQGFVCMMLDDEKNQTDSL